MGNTLIQKAFLSHATEQSFNKLAPCFDLVFSPHTMKVNTVPGGFHFGILPPAGLRDTANLDEETVEDEAGLLGASLAAGGLLTGVETAETK